MAVQAEIIEIIRIKNAESLSMPNENSSGENNLTGVKLSVVSGIITVMALAAKAQAARNSRVRLDFETTVLSLLVKSRDRKIEARHNSTPRLIKCNEN